MPALLSAGPCVMAQSLHPEAGPACHLVDAQQEQAVYWLLSLKDHWLKIDQEGILKDLLVWLPLFLGGWRQVLSFHVIPVSYPGASAPVTACTAALWGRHEEPICTGLSCDLAIVIWTSFLKASALFWNFIFHLPHLPLRFLLFAWRHTASDSWTGIWTQSSKSYVNILLTIHHWRKQVLGSSLILLISIFELWSFSVDLRNLVDPWSVSVPVCCLVLRTNDLSKTPCSQESLAP